jgi:hypothetical protein
MSKPPYQALLPRTTLKFTLVGNHPSHTGQHKRCAVVHPYSVRRYVDLNRAQILDLIDRGSTPAYKACAEAIRGGAAFRIHRDTVARQGVLRIYALRVQTAQLDRVPMIGAEEALKDLSATAYPQIRIAAVSAGYDFALFFDPECVELIALLGTAGRTPR